MIEDLFFIASNRIIQCCYSRQIAVNIAQLRDYRRHSGSCVPDKAFVQGSCSKCVSSHASRPLVEGPLRSRLSGLIGKHSFCNNALNPLVFKNSSAGVTEAAMTLCRALCKHKIPKVMIFTLFCKVSFVSFEFFSLCIFTVGTAALESIKGLFDDSQSIL